MFWLLAEEKAFFSVPSFGRKFVWKPEECLQVLQDIISVANTGGTIQHYLGSLVYTYQHVAGGQKEYVIIDGQQRLVACTLILIAAAQKFRHLRSEKGAKWLEKLIEIPSYVENDELHLKLRLKSPDDSALRAIYRPGLRSRSDHSGLSNIPDCYVAIRSQMERVDPSLIEKGLLGVYTAKVIVSPDKFDIRAMFEQINRSEKAASTDTTLKTEQPVRDKLIQLLQGELDNIASDKSTAGHNGPLADGTLGGSDSTTGTVRSSIADYLAEAAGNGGFTDSSSAEKIRAIIEEASTKDTEGLATELETLAVLIYRIVWFSIPQTANFYQRILKDYSEGTITIEAFRQIVDIVESYTTRRVVCVLSNNDVSGVFASLAHDRELNPGKLFSLLKAQRGELRFPDKWDIKEAVEKPVRDSIGSKALHHFFLGLELALRGYHIEGIEPRDFVVASVAQEAHKLGLRPATFADDSPGNLFSRERQLPSMTLLYRPVSGSDTATMGYSTRTESGAGPLRIHQCFRQGATWGRETFYTYREWLVQQIEAVWPDELKVVETKEPVPPMARAMVVAEQVPTVVGDSSEAMTFNDLLLYPTTGKKPAALYIESKRIPVTNWSDLTILVVEDLLTHNETEAMAFMQESRSFRLSSSKMHRFVRLRNNWFYDTDTIVAAKIQQMYEMVNFCNAEERYRVEMRG